MSHKVHVYSFLATCALLGTIISGCSFQGKSVFAQGLQAADYRKAAATLSAEAYALIEERDYAPAIAKAIK